VYVGANYENKTARVMFLSNREKLYFHFYVSKYAKRASIGIIDDARDILTAYLHLANSQVDVKRRDAIAIFHFAVTRDDRISASLSRRLRRT